MFLVVWQDGKAVQVDVCDTQAEAYDLAEKVSKRHGHSAYVAELLAEIEPPT